MAVTVSEILQARRGVLLTGALLLPLAVCALLAVFREALTPATHALVMVVVVVVFAAAGDRLAGFLAALSSALWFDFFLVPPFHTFTIADADGVEITVLVLLIGLVVNEVALWGRRQEARASRRAGYLDGALRTAEVVAAREGSPDRVAGLVADEIRTVLGVARCEFVPGPVHDARYAVLHHDGTVTRGGRTLDVDRHGLPTDELTALTVAEGDTVRGHFVVTAAGAIAYPSLEQRRVAVLLADQVAAALRDG